MARLIPDLWMPACPMRRIITHWTAGDSQASGDDRDHYHILIEGDGRLVRGHHSIADNVATGDGDYAAHTRGCNTGSIGVALCGMAGAREQPFFPGPRPVTRGQYEVLAQVVAELCRRYEIPVTGATVLGHGEVQRRLGIAQNGKWDPMVLPWDPGRPREAVGAGFRESVRFLLDGGTFDLPDADQLPPISVSLDGALLTDEGLLQAGASWCPLRPLAEALGWSLLELDRDTAVIGTPGGRVRVAAMVRADRGYVRLRDLAARLGWPPPAWDAPGRIVRLRSRRDPP